MCGSIDHLMLILFNFYVSLVFLRFGHVTLRAQLSGSRSSFAPLLRFVTALTLLTVRVINGLGMLRAVQVYRAILRLGDISAVAPVASRLLVASMVHFEDRFFEFGKRLARARAIHRAASPLGVSIGVSSFALGLKLTVGSARTAILGVPHSPLLCLLILFLSF